MKKRRIRWGIIVIIILCIPFLYILGRIGAYALSWAQEPTTDINDYLQHERAGWLDDSPYDIFPDSAYVNRANETKYFYKKLISPTLLFDNEVLEYLTCKFTPEDFYLERQRLELLCGEENTTFFKVPAFIRAEWFPNRFSSYAICNETDYSITYIATQGKLLFEEYVPLELYPREWPWYHGKFDTKMAFSVINWNPILGGSVTCLLFYSFQVMCITRRGITFLGMWSISILEITARRISGDNSSSDVISEICEETCLRRILFASETISLFTN